MVRHAKSAYDWSRWPQDHMRPLSDKGIEREHKCALGMKNANLSLRPKAMSLRSVSTLIQDWPKPPRSPRSEKSTRKSRRSR